jgi:hypothetical protein
MIAPEDITMRTFEFREPLRGRVGRRLPGFLDARRPRSFGLSGVRPANFDISLAELLGDQFVVYFLGLGLGAVSNRKQTTWPGPVQRGVRPLGDQCPRPHAPAGEGIPAP